MKTYQEPTRREDSQRDPSLDNLKQSAREKPHTIRTGSIRGQKRNAPTMLDSAVAVTYCRLISSRQISYVSPNMPESSREFSVHMLDDSMKHRYVSHQVVTSFKYNGTLTLTTICLVGNAGSTRVSENARVDGEDVSHGKECCRRACKLGGKCASSLLLEDGSRFKATPDISSCGWRINIPSKALVFLPLSGRIFQQRIHR